MMSHVVLHLALCNSAIRLKQQTVMPVHVSITDRIHRTIVDQSFTVAREHVNVATVAFDMPWGVYRADIDLKAGRTDCTATQFFGVVNGHDRTIGVTLNDKRAPEPVPTLVFGSAPFAFAYAQPTVVLFDSKTVKCDAEVPDPLQIGDATQNDADGYYATIYPTRDLLAHEPLVPAVRITDSRGDYHYIKVSQDFIRFSGMSWPSVGTFNIDDGAMQYVAASKEDTLLCPKLKEVIVH